MATESDLRGLLRDPEPEGRGAIDLDAVLTRARRRRRPKVVVAQALGSVAALGVLVVGVTATLPQAMPTASSLLVAEDAAGGADEYASVPESSDQSTLRMTADACGAPVAALPADGPLVTEIDPIESIEPGTWRLPLQVTLRNSSGESVSGVTGLPTITIAQDGVVVWHTRLIGQPAREFSLSAGEGIMYPTDADLLNCVSAEGFEDLSADLPMLDPGTYEVRAVIDVDGVPVSGAPIEIVIR